MAILTASISLCYGKRGSLRTEQIFGLKQRLQMGMNQRHLLFLPHSNYMWFLNFLNALGCYSLFSSHPFLFYSFILPAYLVGTCEFIASEIKSPLANLSMQDRLMPPSKKKDAHMLILRTCEHVIVPGRRDFAGVIK